MRSLFFIVLFAAALLVADPAAAQRAASPRGESSTQVGAEFDQWIVVDYGRPILRGRTGVFGEGDTYGETLYRGAPVWRAGANVSTQFMTDSALMIDGKTLPAGEYTLFVELSEGSWTLILSNHKAKADYRSDEEGLWGSYEYSADMDVLRAPMQVAEHPMSFDQFTISFLDVSAGGGTLALMWENVMGTVNFTVAN